MSYGEEGQPVKARLGMWDTVAIIVGIVIGATIFKSPQLIMKEVSTPWMGLGAWLLGGVLSFIGALCYAELASTYPRSGGDYYFLSRAFGSWTGFLFGWAQLAVILTASIGSMAFVFGEYAVKVFPPPGTMPSQEQTEQLKSLTSGSPEHKELDQAISKEVNANKELWTAAFGGGAVVALTLMNLLGVVLGKWVQNLLSLAKVAGLVAIAVIGLQYGQHVILPMPEPTVQGEPVRTEGKEGTAQVVTIEVNAGGQKVRTLTQDYDKNKDLTREVIREFDPEGSVIREVVTRLGPVKFGLAMIFVLYAFGGWNDSAFVAAEIRHRRHIVWALIIGLLLITVVYLIVNMAYLRGLGFEKTRSFGTVLATDVAALHPQVGDQAAKAVGILVMVSALGAINGLIFTGSRVYSSFGADHSLFAFLGKWNASLGAPTWSLLIQGLICLIMIGGVGTQFGRDTIDRVIDQVLNVKMPWNDYYGGFETLVSGTAPVFWAFFLMSGLALFALRQRDRDMERPFTVPVYPLFPLIFCLTCGYMLYSALEYAKWISLIGAIPLALGLPLYWISRERPGLND